MYSQLMSEQLTIIVPGALMSKLRTMAEADFRTPEGEVLWLIQDAVNVAAGLPARPWRANGSLHEKRLRKYQDVVQELQRLHVRAGKPSCRHLAEEISSREYRVAHSTVNTVLNGSVPPSWALLEKLVTAMNGDAAHFKALWVAANE
jgi:hypothetical protein